MQVSDDFHSKNSSPTAHGTAFFVPPSDAVLAMARAALARQGVPEQWLQTPEFNRNLGRLLAALGSTASAVILPVADVTTRAPVAEFLASLSAYIDGAGALAILSRVLLLAALEQPVAAVSPLETYAPMLGFKPAYETQFLNLRDLEQQFFWDHERDGEAGVAGCVDRALKGVVPDVIAIGSGPGCAAALARIKELRPHTAALVFDVGDYFSQPDFDALGTSACGMETMRAGGGQLIAHSPTRMSANFVPQVWGGGAEIFSGTAHRLGDWYLDRMPMSRADCERHEHRIRRQCRVSTTPWDILNDAQKRFFAGAKGVGLDPYLLEGFGRGGDTGNGRCYAGKKERIGYLDNLFRAHKDVVGIANCRVDALQRGAGGRVESVQLSFLSRRTRQVIAVRSLRVPPSCTFLLGAGSLGNQHILHNSGDPVARRHRPGVLHQYTCEVAAIFDEPLSANGIPQGIGVQIRPDEIDGDEVRRRVVIEGAHPGRAVLCAVGVPGALDRMAMWRATPRMGTVGIMFTESKPGTQVLVGEGDVTLQRLTARDYAAARVAIEAGLRSWVKAGCRGVALNMPSRFASADPELNAVGFAAASEVDALLAHMHAHPPIMQVFYRTGHRFGTVQPDSGEVRGFSRVHLVGEDAIPPGPGVNPTLAILMLAQQYAEAAAAAME